MAKKRLPNPGSDEGVWGQVLNDYLRVSHDDAGGLYVMGNDADRNNTFKEPVEGQVCFNKEAGQFQRYNGKEWENISENVKASTLGNAAFKNVGTNAGDVLEVNAVGTAAFKNIGANPGDVVVMDTDGKLPTIDGSKLQNIPTGQLQKWDNESLRPASVVAGFVGLNLESERLERYDGVAWQELQPPSIVSTITDLKSFSQKKNTQVQVLGYLSARDGGGGLFIWDSRSHAVGNPDGLLIPDDGIVIAPASDTTGASGAWVRHIENKTVLIDYWGVFPDGGVTNYTRRFYYVGQFLRANDGMTLIFRKGTYLTQVIDIMGVRNLHIKGNGASFIQPNPAMTNGLRPIIQNNGLVLPQANGNPQFSTVAPDARGNAIQTVEKGSTTISFVNVVDATRYQVGDKVLVYGFDQQFYGYPLNYRFFEFKKVTGVDTTAGTISIESGLRYRYDSRWWTVTTAVMRLRYTYTYDTDNTYSPYIGMGIPDISYTYTPSENIVIEGINIEIANGIWSTGGNETYIRCNIAGYVNITGTEKASFIECDLTRTRYVEPDKVVDTILFDRCKISDISGGTGVHLVHLNGCDIANIVPGYHATPGNVACYSRTLIVENSTFGLGNVQTGSYGQEKVVVRNNTFLTTGSDVNISQDRSLTGWERTITINQIDNGRIVLNEANAQNLARLGIFGTTLNHPQGTYAFDYQNIYFENGGYYLEGSKMGTGTPQVGDVLRYKSILSFEAYNNVSSVKTPYVYNSFKLSERHTTDQIGTKSLRIIITEKMGWNLFFINGYVKSCIAIIQHPMPVDRTWPLIRMYFDHGREAGETAHTIGFDTSKKFVFNGTIAGVREANATAVAGVQAGETIEILNWTYCRNIVVGVDDFYRATSDWAHKCRIIITVEYIPAL